MTVNPRFSRNDARRPGPVSANAGIGLRLPHHRWLMEHRPAVHWLEVHPENYMTDAAPAAELERIATDYPLSLHAVCLSLGSAGGPDRAHLERLRQHAREPFLLAVSEQLRVEDTELEGLPAGIHRFRQMPLPDEIARLAAERIQ